MDIFTLIPNLGTNVLLFTKVAFLIILALYAIFAIMLLNKVLSLSKVVYFFSRHTSFFVIGITIVHLILVLSLFLFTLVIV